MGVFKSIFRYITTLGGLLDSGINSKTDNLVTTPTGIKATYSKTRDKWTKQYTEVREAVAQLMAVLGQKTKQMEELNREADEVKLKMSGAVKQFKDSSDTKYKQAFTDLFTREKELAEEQNEMDNEITELKAKVDAYKEKLIEMKSRIDNLDKEEAEAIADVVSSQQIINLNDRLNNVSTKLDDQNLRAIQQRRDLLKSKAKLSADLSPEVLEPNLDKELLEAGINSEASDVFAAMLAEQEKSPVEEVKEEEKRTREI